MKQITSKWLKAPKLNTSQWVEPSQGKADILESVKK